MCAHVHFLRAKIITICSREMRHRLEIDGASDNGDWETNDDCGAAEDLWRKDLNDTFIQFHTRLEYICEIYRMCEVLGQMWWKNEIEKWNANRTEEKLRCCKVRLYFGRCEKALNMHLWTVLQDSSFLQYHRVFANVICGIGWPSTYSSCTTPVFFRPLLVARILQTCLPTSKWVSVPSATNSPYNRKNLCH